VRGRSDGILYYEMTSSAELEERVFPFFDRLKVAGAEGP